MTQYRTPLSVDRRDPTPPADTISPFLRFNEFASKIQVKPYVKKPIEVHEQILVDEPDTMIEHFVAPNLPPVPISQIPAYEEDPGPSISQRGLRDSNHVSSSKVSVISVTSVTPPRSVILPVPDRVASKPSSNVGMNIYGGGSIGISYAPPVFAVDQTSWNDVTNRVSAQECEVEKLKGATKRYQLQMLQMTQNTESQRIGINDDLKKSEDQLVERLHLSEFQCKQYTDKRIIDETGDIQQKIKILENQIRRDGCITTVTGLFLGILVLSYLLQFMNTLVANPAISYYDISSRAFHPS